MSALANVSPSAEQWAIMIDDFDPALHKAVLSVKAELGDLFPKTRGRHFLANDLPATLAARPVEDDLLDQLGEDVDLLYTTLDKIIDAAAEAKSPPREQDTGARRIPRNVRAVLDLFDDNAIASAAPAITADQHDNARFLLQMCNFDGVKATPPDFHEEGQAVFDATSKRVKNAMAKNLINNHQEESDESIDFADRMMNLPPLTDFMIVSQYDTFSFLFFSTKYLNTIPFPT